VKYCALVGPMKLSE